MLDFQQKRKMRSLAYHNITLILLAILVLFAVHSVWSVYQKQSESELLKHQALDQVALLSAREAELHSSIDRLGTDQGVEAEIRSKFSVVKGDETMVVLVDDQGSSTQATTTPKSLWQKFLHLLHI